ncbi:BamA/TamA family outer membrane protein (plasmid) [Qingshengfaniella alkalisoli]|uniref:BamA/TamA family outer membrane protein n=2 Tax=Qingshengfaniella alkalisoli TaxID=2599296 RepID=A0A5B8J0L2_9RHOB|nr:BamA/TamA family outer membrane protein [Qingshengfaniella alkalisoli]
MTCGTAAGIDYLEFELRAIEDCLMSTGVFEAVQLYEENGSLIIEVEEIEMRPGRVEGALSYDTQDGAVLSFSFERYNLFPDTFGALHLDLGRETHRYSAALYRADALGPALDAGIDLEGYRTDYDDLRYKEDSLRGDIFLAWTPSDRVRAEVGAGYRDHRMEDVEDGASELLLTEEASVDAPYLRLALDYVSLLGEQQDEPEIQPGVSLRLDQYFWNIGTDDPLSDTRAELVYRMPLSPDMRVLLGLNGGYVQGLDDNATRAIDRYFPGANTFRGFAPRGIGPRDDDDVLGGNRFLVGSLELQRDLGDLLGHSLRGGIFVETGGVWGLDDTLNGQIDDDWHRRSTVGVSATFDVANTPVSLYLAHPVEKEADDNAQLFGLSISATF